MITSTWLVFGIKAALSPMGAVIGIFRLGRDVLVRKLCMETLEVIGQMLALKAKLVCHDLARHRYDIDMTKNIGVYVCSCTPKKNDLQRILCLCQTSCLLRTIHL